MTVTSFQSGGARDDGPIDSIALNFPKVEIEYQPVSPKGALGPAVKGRLGPWRGA